MRIKIDKGFHSKAEYRALDPAQQCLTKRDEYIPVDRMKDEFIALIKEFPDDKRTIVSFLLSTLLNKIAMSREGYRLFCENKNGKAMLFVEFALFMYAFCPCFDHARKVISMLVHMDSEIKFSKKGSNENDKLQKAINRYAFVFQRANLPDICDWFVLFNDFNICLDSQTEEAIINNAETIDNPIIWANILLYSHYYQPFFQFVKQKVESIVKDKVDRISPCEQMLQDEFWYVLIFHNCTLLNANCQRKIQGVITDIKTKRNEQSEKLSQYEDICDDFLFSKFTRRIL